MQKVIITPRDRDLFLYLFQNKIANVQQIKRDLFPKVAMQTMYVRLGKLRKAGWIESTPYMERKTISSYFNVTPECVKHHLEESIEVKGGSFKSDSISHDLKLNDIRKYFLGKKRIKSYFTENELVSNNDLKENRKIASYGSTRVDAVVRVEAKNGDLCHLGMEYEHTLKSKKRCREKVRRYYLRPQAEVILFIYRSKSIYNCFKKVEEDFAQQYRRPKLFFLSLKEVTSENHEVIFRNIHGDRVCIQ